MANKITRHTKGKHPIGRVNYLLNNKTSFAAVEAYKVIRTNLLFAMSPLQIKTVVISSANSAEGKSTTAANLAMTFAQLNAKVLLIDGDLRKPTQHKFFKLNNTYGLSGILAKIDNVEKGIKTDVAPNLDVLTSGMIPPNPMELLATTTMQNLIRHLETIYDYIIIDMPPINVVSDAMVVLNERTGITLVAKQNETTYSEYEKALDAITRTTGVFLGGIVTQVNAEEKEKGYRYNYRSYEYK